MSELLHKIAITQIPKVGPVLIKNLISYCGGLEAVFEEKKSNLEKIPGIGPIAAKNIFNADNTKRAEQEIKFIERNNIKPYFYLDDNYPHRLKHFPDAPTLLYYKGTDCLNSHRTVGIVGTRKPTEKGKIVCEQLVQGLQKYNTSIISGLAYGIDSCAHRQATQIGIPNIGVLGHGLDMIYPATNRKLASQMIENGGILSEFISGTKPDFTNFPQRNRVIAMLSDAIVVVESAKKGGSIISAEFGLQYHKDVFAIPGRVTDEMSSGCNKLIKQNRAALLESADDIGYIMNWEESSETNKNKQASLFVELSSEEQEIVSLLRKEKEMALDKLHYSTGIPLSNLSSILLNLEFSGIVKPLPGKKYILL
jgi:DNA processing protein